MGEIAISQNHKKLNELLARASSEKPDQNDVIALRKFLAQHPELWRQTIGLSEMAINNFIGQISNDEKADVLKEIFKVRIKALKEDLGCRDTSTLEGLLIDAVVMAYLRWAWTEIEYSSNTNDNRVPYFEKRLSAAQQRYLRACETLARVRKLSRGTPELQHEMSNGLAM